MMKTIDRSAVCRSLLGTLLVLTAPVLFATEVIAPPPDVASPPPGAERTPSGLASMVLEPGDGDARPRSQDIVLVDYTGWTTDGEMFDSSVARGEPAGLRLETLIPGWREGIQLMVTGEKRRFWIPEALAYAGADDRPQGMLVFEVELIRFERRTPAEVPPDVAAPPADAEEDASGIFTKVIAAGDGLTSPTARSTVTVHYTGWTTDGAMFDSSIPGGKPIAFPLSGVIKGWREGLKLMVAGETRRMWIPEKLAYKGQRGKPQGMLVFDVELLGFTD